MICDLKLNNIRYLTSTECFRLMGFFNDEINLEGISESSRLKLAGNGWDVNLFRQVLSTFLREFLKQ
jgi:site-specific DNA-cytosine methylase